MIPRIPMNHAYSVAEKICIKDEKKLRIGINIDPTINKIFPNKIRIGCGRFLIPLSCKVYFIMVLNVINEDASVNANQFLNV
jgi:hypothetical protein